MIQAHNSCYLNQGSFGGGGGKEDIFWTLLKAVLTGVKENSKFVGLSSWKDGVIYWVGKVCERMSGTWAQSLISDMLSLRSFLETFKWRW